MAQKNCDKLFDTSEINVHILMDFSTFKVKLISPHKSSISFTNSVTIKYIYIYI